MALTRSPARPPLPSDDVPENSVAKVVKGQDTEGDTNTKDEFSAKSDLLVSELLREEQVQNAVKFLSHPKVRDSSAMRKRSFLENKGLTKEEIDEAFRQVPDPPSNLVSGEAVSLDQGMQSKLYGTVRPQIANESSQLASGDAITYSMVPRLKKTTFHWSQALYAFGILAFSGAGTIVIFKKKIIPWIKTWIRKVAEGNGVLNVDDKSKVTESIEAAKSAASAAALVVKASQELLNVKAEERKYFEAFFGLLSNQMEQMKSIGHSIRNLESSMGILYSQNKQPENFMQPKLWHRNTGNGWIEARGNQLDPNFSSILPKLKINDSQNIDSGLVKQLPAPSKDPEAAPFSNSYLEIMEMIQKGEKPPNIKDIDDRPPNPDQPLSKPHLAPRLKPWEISQPSQQRPSSNFQTQASTEQGFGSNVNKPRMNDESFEGLQPLWKRSVQVSEVNTEAQSRLSSLGMGGNGFPSNGRWVPPQTPAISMPEAASAIRQPNPAIQENPEN